MYRFFGISWYWTTTKERRGADYERIFGQPCEHTFRKGGMSTSEYSLLANIIGCGSTAEGVFFSHRMRAVSAAFDAERRIHDRELTLVTFRLIDTLMPPDTEMSRQRDLPSGPQTTLVLLGALLRDAENREHWRAVLDSAGDGFRDIDNNLALPRRLVR